MAVLALGSCANYRAEPITTAQTDRALAAPAPTVICARIAAMRHPILPSLPCDLSAPIPVAALACVAVAVNPDLVAARDARAEAAAQVLAAGILPNPQISGGLLFPSHPSAGESIGTSIGLSWDASALLTRSLRMHAAREQADSVDLGIAWQEWQTALAAAEAGCRWAAALERLGDAGVARDAIEPYAARIHAAAASGEATAGDAVQIDAAASDAQELVATAQADADGARLQALHLLGLPPSEHLRLAAPPWAAWLSALDAALVDDRDEDADLDRLASARLDLQGLRCGYLSQEDTLHAAVRAQFPRISLGVAGGRDTTAIESAGPNITMDLPLFDRNQAAVRGAEATRTRLRDEYRARLADARADEAQIAGDVADAHRRLTEAQRVRGLAQAQLARGRAALAAGQRDILGLAGDILASAHADAAVAAQRERLAFDLLALCAVRGIWLLPDPESGRRTAIAATERESP